MNENLFVECCLQVGFTVSDPTTGAFVGMPITRLTVVPLLDFDLSTERA